MVLNLALNYQLIKVLISNFSYILASTFFSPRQQAVCFLFVFRFCATPWITDEMAATCAIDIWPNFVTIVKDWEGQCKSKHPNNKSSETLVGHYQHSSCSTENGVFQVHCKHVAEAFDRILNWKAYGGFPVQCP